MNMSKFYKLIEHTADIGMRVQGETQDELFINAARAMMDIMIGCDLDDAGRGVTTAHTIEVGGADRGELMVKWLQEILYLLETKRQVAHSCHIKSMTQKKLVAEVDLKPFDFRTHDIRREIKGVTYHKLRVEQLSNGKFEAEVIFDI